MIKAAAIAYPVSAENKDRVYRMVTGRSHAEVRLKAMDMDIQIYPGEREGFITDTNDFLSREQAATHAFACGQIREKCEKLFSTDLQITVNP